MITSKGVKLMKKRLSNLKEKLNFDDEKIKDKSKNIASNILKKSGKMVDTVSSKSKELYENRQEIVSNIKDKSSELTKDVVSHSKDLGTKTKEVAKKTNENLKNVDLFNTRIKQKSIDDYNLLVEKYEVVANGFVTEVNDLFEIRQEGLKIIKTVEEHINTIANTPKEFEVELKRIGVEIFKFESKQKEIEKAEQEAKLAAAGAGTGATMGALGVAVVTLGPTAAMSIATTFGVASTGTAISSLSGAAATNAALAWLGGGTLAMGGGGMSAGTALLALAGPVGWTIAGVAFTASIGSGIFASNKNKEMAAQLISERQNLEVILRKFEGKTYEANSLAKVTQTQQNSLQILNKQIVKTDYSTFNEEEKLQAGVLVNSAYALAELINKELSLDD